MKNLKKYYVDRYDYPQKEKMVNKKRRDSQVRWKVSKPSKGSNR